MAVHPRNLMLFLALVGAALATFILSREPVGPAAAGRSRESAPQGNYLVDAVRYGIDADGRIAYRIFADRIEQKSESDNLVLEKMRIQYTPTLAIHWGLTAENGVMPVDSSTLDLLDVRLVSMPDDGGDPVVIETSELRLDAGKYLASTEKAVYVRRGQSVLCALGMRIDMEANTYELNANVTTRCAP